LAASINFSVGCQVFKNKNTHSAKLNDSRCFGVLVTTKCSVHACMCVCEASQCLLRTCTWGSMPNRVDLSVYRYVCACACVRVLFCKCAYVNACVPCCCTRPLEWSALKDDLVVMKFSNSMHIYVIRFALHTPCHVPKCYRDINAGI